MSKQLIDETTSEDFEGKLDKLREIVGKLESDISLEDGMKLFESGLALTGECLDELDKAQANIEELKGKLDLILDRNA